MKKIAFLKATLTGAFLAASLTAAQAATVDAACTTTEKHWMPEMTVPFAVEQDAPSGQTRFTLGMVEFDDLFSRDGSSTVIFMSERDVHGVRDAQIDGIPVKLTERYEDEAVEIEMATGDFEALFSETPDSIMSKNNWSCNVTRPAP